MADTCPLYRSRDALARGEFDSAAPDASSDPLAELARLIGQSDANGEGGRRRYQAADTTRTDTTRTDTRRRMRPAAPRQTVSIGRPTKTMRSRAVMVRAVTPRPRLLPHLIRRFIAGSGLRGRTAGGAAIFLRAGRGLRWLPRRRRRRSERRLRSSVRTASAPAPGRRALPFSVAPREQPYPARADEHDGGQDYAPDDYDDEDDTPRRPSGLVLVMAVLGLAVIGTAGAFGYRAMFGGSMLPMLPPIIKAIGGPNKIVPTEAPAANPGQPGAAAAPPALAPPPEQPVDLNKTAPRVVSTIPVGPGADPAAPIAPVPPAPAPALPPPAAVAPVPPPPPAQTSAEPKRVHTVQNPCRPADGKCRAGGPAVAPAGERAAAPARQRAALDRSRRRRRSGSGTRTAALPRCGASRARTPDGGERRTGDGDGGARHLAAAAMPCRFPPSAARPRPRRRSARCGPSSRRSSAAASRSFAAPISAPKASIIAPWSARLPRWRRRRACAASLKAAGGNCLIQRN